MNGHVTMRRVMTFCALMAAAVMLFVGHARNAHAAGGLAGFVLVLLVIASVLAFVGERDADDVAARSSQLTSSIRSASNTSSTKSWLLANAALILALSVSVATWFRGAPAIAGGDITPPGALAWTDRFFTPWSWTGGDLGSPNGYGGRLVWAVVLRVVDALGGSGGAAQQVYYTLLVVGAGLVCLRLLTVAGLRLPGAFVGAFCFIANPFTISFVATNPVFWSGMLLMAWVVLTCLTVALGRTAPLRGAALIGITGPLFALAYLNPPVMLAIAMAGLIGLIAVAASLGRAAAWRYTQTLVLGGVAAALVMAYALVPSLYALGFVAQEQLSTLDSWAFTESRSTLDNALWLNTTWGWLPEYSTYAARYSNAWLSSLRYAPVALAALALAMPRMLRAGQRRVAGVLMLGVVLLMLLSLGTRFPSGAAFKALYGLPYGWLLREPGRFLIVAILGVAVLVGLFVDAAMRGLRSRGGQSSHRRALAVPVISLALLGGVSLPLLDGELIRSHTAPYPETHTALPEYWLDAAKVINRSTDDGAVLVLPANDFYQMPYDWYYGAGDFVSDLLNRRSISPVKEGYSPASAGLYGAVTLIQTRILQGRWDDVADLMGQVGASQILVRGDIDPHFANRTIADPAELTAQLRRGERLTEVQLGSPLHLFRLEQSVTDGAFVTADSDVPDLRALSLLAKDTAIVTSSPLPGRAHLLAAPAAKDWTLAADGHLSAPVTALSGRTVMQADLSSTSRPQLAPLRDGRATIVPHGASLLKGAVVDRGRGCDAPALAGKLGCLSRPIVDAPQRVVMTWSGPVAKADVASATELCFVLSNGACVAPEATSSDSDDRFAAVGSAPDNASIIGVAATGVAAKALASSSTQVRVIARTDSVGLLAAAPAGESATQKLTILRDSFTPQWTSSVGTKVSVDGMMNGWLGADGKGVEPRFAPATKIRAAQWVSLIVWLGCLVLIVVPVARRRFARGSTDSAEQEAASVEPVA